MTKLQNFLTIFLFSLFFPDFSASLAASSIPAAQKAVFEILNSSSYHKDVRPDLVTGNLNEPTNIKVNLYVRKIQRIDDVQMEITLQLTVRQLWNDSRLRYKTADASLEYVTLDESLGDMLWTPDLFFNSETSAFIHNVLKPNSYKRVYPDGRVLWSTRLTMTFSCPMDLRYFPFDKQKCRINLLSYSETAKDIVIQWDDPCPVQFGPKSYRNSKFDLTKNETGEDENKVSVAGMFSSIYLALFFQRQSGLYLTNIFIPCFMVVILSWISFWLGEAISSRLSLTLTLLLTLATQTQSFNQNMPQVSYTKAIDIWTGACMTFACLSILETSSVAYLLQHRKEKRVQDSEKPKFPENLKKNETFILDKISRVLFPLAFFLFTIVYTVIYVFGENYPALDI